MARIAAFALGFAVLSSPIWADIIVLKDGNIMEVKFIEAKKKDKKDILVFENEKKEKFECGMKDIKPGGWFKKKPSWEKRAEELAWYEKEKAKERKTWDAEAKLGSECRRRDLDAQSRDHYLKAYELRKPTIKDDEKDHEAVSKWLETTAELFDESVGEMRAVLEYKRKKVGDVLDGHINLAKFCENEGMLPEAEEEWQAALKLAPTNSTAKSGLEKLRRAMEFPFDPGLRKSVAGAMKVAAKFLRAQQNPDGTFGADAAYYGVHGHRAMTCLSIIALMCQWEFEMLDKGDAAREVPKEISTAFELILEHKHPMGAGLRGFDIWGAIFEIDLLARASRKKAMERYHARIRTRMPETLKELDGYKKGDGGWMYYDFVNGSASFPTAAAILNLLNAKNSGFHVDEGMISGALNALEKLKFAEGSYNYHEDGLKGMHPSNSPVGASARSALGEGACLAAGKGSENSLRMSVDYFFRWRPVLAQIKGEGGTHIGKGMVAPYYFLFGHYWTTRVVKLLPVHRGYLFAMRSYMLSYMDPDGSFWDWKGEEVPYKVYGTALAMMTMYHIASTEKDPALGHQKLAAQEKPKEPENSATPTPDK